MTISKVNPGGWGVGDTFTAAQSNSFDTKIITALDKSAAGDTVAATSVIIWPHGSRAWNKGGRWSVDTDGSFGGLLDVINGTITLSTANSSMTVSAGGSISVIGGGTTGTILIGSDGYLQVGSNGRLQLQSGSVNTFQSGSATTIASGSTFEWAASQYPGLATAHTGRVPVRKIHLGAYTVAGTGWGYAATGNGVTGPTAGAGAAATGYIALPGLYHGAVLTTIELLFTPNTAHTGLPATNITAALNYRTFATAAASALVTVGSASAYTPVSLADYIDGKVKSLTIAAGGPTIDAATNAYVLSIVDEYGGASPLLTTFHALKLTYAITDLHPQ